MSNESFYFDPDGKGLAMFLGPTEATLMELAWRHNSLTVKRAVTLLSSEKSPAYTTVMTILNRLTEKGLLTRSRDGRNFVYSPTSSRAEFIDTKVSIVDSALRRNFSNFNKANND